MIPGLKGLHTHELARKCVYEFGSRPDMSMKVGNTHFMRTGNHVRLTGREQKI